MKRGRIPLLAWAILVLPLAGCALFSPGVPIDSRPTPPQPPPIAANPDSANPAQPDRPAPAISDATRKSLLGRVSADTTAAGAAVRQCAGQKLLPDQEGVVDATLQLLEATRAALMRDDLVRAESLARRARQLAASLNCP